MKNRAAGWLLAVVFSFGAGATGIMAGWYWQFYMPYCVRKDCQGQEIHIEQMKGWERREEQGTLGILRMAGWRVEKQQTVLSISTGRRQRAQVICVYGSMDLVEPAAVLSGRYGQAAGEDYCVLSEDLARHLFGAVEAAGEWVKMEEAKPGGMKLQVAGVIEKDGDFLMLPATEGEVEQLAVEFRGRMGADEKVGRLMEQ